MEPLLIIAAIIAILAIILVVWALVFAFQRLTDSGDDTAAASSNSLTAYGNGSSRSAEGYAIPITQAKSLADTILAGTKTSTNHIGHRAALGIAVVPSGSSRGGMTPYGGSSGVTVQNVQSGSAEVGDIAK